jgi:hypothetical protein
MQAKTMRARGTLHTCRITVDCSSRQELQFSVSCNRSIPASLQLHTVFVIEKAIHWQEWQFCSRRYDEIMFSFVCNQEAQLCGEVAGMRWLAWTAQVCATQWLMLDWLQQTHSQVLCRPPLACAMTKTMPPVERLQCMRPLKYIRTSDSEWTHQLLRHNLKV